MRALMLGFAVFLLLPARAFGEPAVVASIGPVHSLVAGVMDGVGAPFLLIRGAGSPHAHALRPSEARAVAEADRLFWIGPPIESFLERLVDSLPPGTAVALADRAGIALLPLREAGTWEAHAHHDDAHQEEAGRKHGHEGHDGHVWLDPSNAARMVEAIVEELSGIDPANGARYRANGAALAIRLDALDRELRTVLAPLRTLPYIVFHDAYQYFEARYGTNAVGSITLSAERPPGARRISEIRATIAEAGVSCVFSEPQFEPRVIATLIEGTPARSATLDPLGAALEPGPGAYFALMRGLAAALTDCLAREP